MKDIDNQGFDLITFLVKKRAVALLVLIVVMDIVFSLILPKTFGTYSNFTLILLNMSAESMVLIAIAMVLIMGDIDLSLGSIMVLGGIITGRLMIVSHVNMWLAMAVALGISLVCGMVNGFIIAKIGVNSFIATLGTGMIFQGIAVMLAGTGWTDFPDPTFKALGQTKVMGIQMPVFYMVVIVVVFSVLVAGTRYFRQLYYIGGNYKSAELSGINILKVRIVIHVIAAALACLGGIFTAMRFNSSMPNIGSGAEMRAVTASVIGGISFTGGTGTLPGAAMGALFVATLNNILTSVGVNPNTQFCVTGIVLILAIVLDIMIMKRGARK
jgi:ribose transport system permease protein